MAGLTPAALLALAFSAGTATFFAPCAFPLLPGYLSYFLGDSVAATAGAERSAATEQPSDGERPPDTERQPDGRLVDRLRHPLGRAVLVSVAGSLGMTLVYVGLAGTTVALGAQALADVAVLELVVGTVFVVAGVAMAAGWTPDRSVVRLPERRRSFGGFFVFGVLYAGAAAGCTAPLFIAVVARGIAAGPALGVGLAVAYALGMSLVLSTLTVAAALGGSSLASSLRRHTGRIHRIAGGLLALSGVAEIYYYFYGFPEMIPR